MDLSPLRGDEDPVASVSRVRDDDRSIDAQIWKCWFSLDVDWTLINLVR